MAKNEQKTSEVKNTPEEQDREAAQQDKAPKPFVPKVKKLVTLPTLTIKGGETVYIKFLSEISVSKVIQKDKDGKDQEPAHIAQVFQLDTGEARTLIVNAVLNSIMVEEYPNHSYKEKGFQITAANPKAGKRYKGFTVAELEL